MGSTSSWGSTSGWGPFPVRPTSGGTHFRFGPTSELDPLPVWIRFWLGPTSCRNLLPVWTHFRFGSTSGLDPLPVWVHFRFGPLPVWGPLLVGGPLLWGPLLVWAQTGSGPQTGSGTKPEVDPNWKWVETQNNHPKMQQNILLHSSMITPDIGLNSIFCCLKMK